MGGKLVTIATFDHASQAHLAKNLLDAANIQATLTDEMTVDLFWSLSTAVGGIKLKVLEEDAERAITVLEEELGPDDSGEVDPEQFAVEAEAAEPEDGAAPAPAPKPTPTPVPSLGSDPAPLDEIPLPSERDEYARRLFFASLLGVVCPPLAFIALYFFFNAAFGAGALSPRGRFRIFVSSFYLLGGLIFSFAVCYGLGWAFR